MDVNQVLQGCFTNAELDLQLDWHRQFCEDRLRKKDVLTKALNSQALQQAITNLLACQQTQTDPRISMKDAAAEPQLILLTSVLKPYTNEARMVCRHVRSHMRPAKGLVIPPDRYLLSTPQLFDQICMTLGGHMSEEIFFGTDQITTGAWDDLQKITRMVFEAVANYGMGAVKVKREGFQEPFSEKTGEMLDNEVQKMINLAHIQTTELLTEKHSSVEKVAQQLIEKETSHREDIISLLGKQPFAGHSDEMDKWLDTNPTFGERQAPLPSIEGSPFLW
ncbi:hypothetical protein K439DRAFT_1625223 [Ramaria rubella]|nr:hypothetical protein K439DRAFT_1625223 [Ramaria rubella]